ncbi:response regulator [Candidatus Saccharibacteria bacterium]|nr:response regulator [Candidatus Saccharibacteria bacterium]
MTKILLVEDDKSLREIYGVRLLAEGYDIVSAGDGEEALAMAIKERPQLIVSDVMMPKISGFDMLDILRSTTETKGIKVIMMTALSSEDQRARGEALGADRYLVKSQVGIEDVVRTVHDVLGDSLVVPQTAQQTFGTPSPSAVARPTMPVAPRQDVSFGQPVVQAPRPQPVAPPAAIAQPAPPQPVQVPPQPVINAPVFVATPPRPFVSQPENTPNPLPQPTAPFSSPRPASLGDRVIHPLTDQPPTVDVGSLINQELTAAATPQFTIPQPPAPTAPPAPSINPITPGQSQTL